jgi:uncharacterized protein
MNATAVETATSRSGNRLASSPRLPLPRIAHILRLGLLGAVAVVFLATLLLGLVQKWLWMRQLNYVGIFWTLFSIRWGLFVVAALVALVYLWLNLRSAAKAIGESGAESPSRTVSIGPSDGERTIKLNVNPRLFVYAMGVAVIFVSLIFATSISAQWDTFLRFRYGGSFGVVDPLFSVDLGFYFFRLPFYELLQGSITFLTLAALAILSVCTLLELRQSNPSRGAVPEVTTEHLVVLLFILIANFGWGFYLDRYELVYSTLGVVHGAGYAAAHVTRVALWMMVGASVLACTLLAWSFFRPRFKTLAIGIGTYALFYVVVIIALPRLFQTIVVSSERTKA